MIHQVPSWSGSAESSYVLTSPVSPESEDSVQCTGAYIQYRSTAINLKTVEKQWCSPRDIIL